MNKLNSKEIELYLWLSTKILQTQMVALTLRLLITIGESEEKAVSVHFAVVLN